MAQQEEPLYDFPEPTQPSERKFLGHQREGSLRNISVLDRLLLTIPVWFQLSINPATALHILQREPPGTFLVRRSRTSQRNVLCVRLADDCLPSFVQQFGIREEHSTLSLETSAISFPDLPRLIAFYCVSRDVLPFPLELPEAFAKATSHKELESVSHMGVEFWSSHLNVRGPREASKPQKDKKSDTVTSALPAAKAQTSSTAKPDSPPKPDSECQPKTAPESNNVSNPTLFHEFCPITTRSPRELNYGSGLGALCFINPLFLQSQNALSRRRMFKRSLKVRVSTETSTLLSPPLAPPPPPPLMPKLKGKCRALKLGQANVQPSKGPGLLQGGKPSQVTQMDPTSQNTNLPPLTQTHDASREARVQQSEAVQAPVMEEQGPGQARVEGEAIAQPSAGMENLADDSDYMQPAPMIICSQPRSLSPYLPASVSPTAPPLFPKLSPITSPHDSPPGAVPSLSPYQSPSLSPKVPHSLSLHDSPSASPSLSPYQSPCFSPRTPFSLSPFTSPSLSQLTDEQHATLPRSDKPKSRRRAWGEEGGDDDDKDEDDEIEELHKQRGDGGNGLVLQIDAASLNDTDSCSSFSSLEEAAEAPPHLPWQDDGTSL